MPRLAAAMRRARTLSVPAVAAAAVTGLLAPATAAAATSSQPTTPATVASAASAAALAAASGRPQGIDVSRYQSSSTLTSCAGSVQVDWTRVRASGRSFAFVKASGSRPHGVITEDPCFERNWAGVQAAGLFRGAYHYAIPSRKAGSAAADARFFVGVTGSLQNPGDLPPVLDLEQSGGLTPPQLSTWTRQFLGETARLTGRTPILYTYPNFWRTSMAGTREFTGYPLWIASYTTASKPFMPAWSRWTFWQYSAASTVPGIVGTADMNRFNGTLEELRKLANLAPAAKTGPAVKVTAALSATRTTRNKSVTLRGRVAPVVTGQTVYRQGYYSGAWHTWASTTVARSGSYAFTIKPTKKAVNKYRVLVPAASKRKASVSTTLTLTVR